MIRVLPALRSGRRCCTPAPFHSSSACLLSSREEPLVCVRHSNTTNSITVGSKNRCRSSARAARAQRRPKQQLCRHEPACSVLLCPALTAARVVQHASMYPRTCSKDRLPLSQSMNTDGPASCGRGRPPAHAARHQAYAAGHPAHAALYQARADRHQACTAQHQARKAQHQACTARHQAYGPTSSTRGPTSSCPASSSRGPG